MSDQAPLSPSLVLPLQVEVDGLIWKLFGVDFKTDGKSYGTYLYALDAGHATMIVEDLKATAAMSGELLGVVT
ncbi:MAG TPA: hypothetical protein PLP22_02000 [Candidatus Competibacter sp.]|nr:hypothetical protein [Candidatus Competibacteraceae bacterium]HRE53549.1 hypothetical protein [Candidatus Competibacter sp.]HUM93268.1 hypothetical protein [Candidatus Competibacter sp.]